MTTSKPATKTAPLLGKTFDVGGRRLALHRSGDGGPAVVFLPGAGLIGLDFLNIQQEVAKFTTSVIYDRGGTGWSDDIALPRTAAAAAEELHVLLAAAGVAPPYVLVGHSLGGAYIRRYAQLFPDEVAGLLFLDPAHEAYAAAPKQSVWGQIRQTLAMLKVLPSPKTFYRPMFETMFRAWPQALRERLVDYHLGAWSKSLAEAKNLQTEVLDEIAGGGAMPAAPMIVLTAMGIDPFMAPFMNRRYLRALNASKEGFYNAFAASVANGESRSLPDAGHSTLHTDRPDAVIEAIRQLVDRSSASARLVA